MNEYLEIFTEDKDDDFKRHNEPLKLKKKIDYDTANHYKPKQKSTKEKVDDTFLKIVSFMAIIVFAYIFYKPFTEYFLEILKSNPTSYKYYLMILAEINNRTLSGLFIMSIFGSLFCLILPSEAIFLYYINNTLYNISLIIFITVAGSIVGLCFNYFFGLLLGERVLRFLFKSNYSRYRRIVQEYGSYFVFFGNIFPGPMEAISVFFGSFRYNLKKYIILSGLGRLIKYIAVFFIYIHFWDVIMIYYQNFINLL